MPAAPRLAQPTLHHLEQLVEGLTAGVILVDPSGAILNANPAALKMHGVKSLADLGETADDYCALRQRNHHRLTRREYPIMRMLAGESFPDMIVEVAPVGANEPRWTHQVHDVVMDVDGGEPDCLALVLQDVSEQYEAEARFEAMFQANPAPAKTERSGSALNTVASSGAGGGGSSPSIARPVGPAKYQPVFSCSA